jgi:hypothetical protein
MPVTVRNDGAAAWGSESIGDAYLVVSWDRGSMVPEIAATLRLDLAPGAAATTSISVLAPRNPGHHLLRVEVVTVQGGSLLSDGIAPCLVVVEVVGPLVRTVLGHHPNQ